MHIAKHKRQRFHAINYRLHREKVKHIQGVVRVNTTITRRNDHKSKHKIHCATLESSKKFLMTLTFYRQKSLQC